MKIKLLCLVMLMATSCTHLTNQEKNQWRELQNLGVRDNEDPVASPGAAGALNILPGFGNFYLASGNGGDSSHWIYGALNLVTWPFSIIWGVPEAAIDASTINKRELIYHYHFDTSGKEQLKKLQNDNK